MAACCPEENPNNTDYTCMSESTSANIHCQSPNHQIPNGTSVSSRLASSLQSPYFHHKRMMILHIFYSPYSVSYSTLLLHTYFSHEAHGPFEDTTIRVGWLWVYMHSNLTLCRLKGTILLVLSKTYSILWSIIIYRQVSNYLNVAIQCLSSLPDEGSIDA